MDSQPSTAPPPPPPPPPLPPSNNEVTSVVVSNVTEDGYLGDCSSDGGNEKNFPMPADRIKRGRKCSCHPFPEETNSDDGNAAAAAVDPPAGLAFQNVRPSDLFKSSCGGGYQVLSSSPHRDHQHSSRKLRSSLKSRLFQHHQRGGNGSWSSMKASMAEKKVRVHAGTNNSHQLERLLANGADPNAADEHGRTALHIAAAKGYAEVVSTMLRSGAEPNQKDALGNTPLHLAACTNHIEVVTLLLRAGTNVETLDNNGRTPMQLAQSKLKLFQKNTGSTEMGKVKTEVAQVVEMMREYLAKTCHAQTSEYSELLNSFSHRLNLHRTHDDINSDLQNLLNSLGNLSLKKSCNEAPTT